MEVKVKVKIIGHFSQNEKRKTFDISVSLFISIYTLPPLHPLTDYSGNALESYCGGGSVRTSLGTTSILTLRFFVVFLCTSR
jgi:hypothetical protein